MEDIVFFCKYLPRSQAFSLMSADYSVYAYYRAKERRSVVASTCVFLAYTGAHQVENKYEDELYQTKQYQIS